MPNIGSIYNNSMTTLCGSEQIKQNAINLFSYLGRAMWVETQNELDIATAIAGSGPAFLAEIAQGMIDGGVRCGLSYEQSLKLVQGVTNSFNALIDDKTPSRIIKEVMSPNGTTAAGYEVLKANNIKENINDTIFSAYNRALELGKL
jgi:pyrroline-5-carboxylate reductase